MSGLLALAACSRLPDSGDPELVSQLAAPLQVAAPSVTLGITLPDVQDPMFAGLTIPTDAPLKGMWSPTRDWPLNGLHSALLPNGRVLTYGTPAANAATQDGRTFDVWDPAQGFTSVSHRTSYDAQQVNSFCSSAAFLSNGTLLISGGNSPLDSSEFAPATGAVTTSAFKLAEQRWYGSMITLPDGRPLMLGGSVPYAALRAYQDPAAAVNAGSVSMTPEIYEPGTGFRSLFGAYSREAFGPDYHRYWYPRAWVAPNGQVFGISSEKMWYLDYSGSGSLRVAGDFKTGADPVTRPNIGPTSTAVMFAPGRILQVGGNGYHDGYDSPSSALASVIDINGANPVVTETAPMSYGRQWPNSTVLPDGRVAVTGGTRYANNGGSDAVYPAELWDPTSGTWTVGASAAQVRVYHSSAILMPNATVLSTGGGAPGPVNNLNAEVYYPPYLFRAATAGGAELAPRPKLRAVNSLALGYGQALDVDLVGETPIQKAVLIGASSATHSFNTAQRRLELAFVQNGSRLAVGMPASGVEAPPGYYELFLLDAAGVPSSAVLFSLGNVAPPPVTTLLPRGNEVTLSSLSNPDYAMATDAQSLGILKLLGATPTDADLLSARFIVRDGLADSNCVSFEPVSAPGKWLRHYAYRLQLGTSDGSDLFKSDATFCPEAGLAGTGITLRSKNYPTRVIHQRNYQLWIDPVDTTPAFPLDASFKLWGAPLPTLPAVAAPIVAAGAQASYAPAISLSGASYTWDFGDGNAPTDASSSPSAGHSYAQPGLYLVTLTVHLADGRSVVKTFVQAVRGVLTAGAPRASSSLAVEARGSSAARLWVVNPDNDSVSAFDTASLTKVREVAVGASPRSVAVAPDGRVWVTARSGASISIVDPSSLAVVQTLSLPAASRPHGLVFSPSAALAFVSLDGTGRVLELDAATGAVLKTLDGGSNPRGLSVTANGARLLVSRFKSPPVVGEATATPQTASAVGEVRVVDLPAFNSTRLIALQHSNLTDGSVQGRGMPNYLGAAVVAPDGASAWVPSKQDNIARGTLRDGQSVDFQNTLRAITSRIDLNTETETLPRRVDHDNAGFASAAVFHPSGVYLFVALETARQVAVVNPLTGADLLRIEVGRAPQGLTLSADGKRLFVHNFMDRSVSAVDLSPLVDNGEFQANTLATLAAVATEKLASNVLLGKQLFYDARDPRLARDAYLSCASCHADGEEDGRVWDFTGQGEGLRNTISLVGRAGGQGLLHWSGNFDEVQDFEGQIRSLSLGTGLMSDAAFLTGTRSQPLGDRKTGLSSDLDALAAYLGSLTTPTPSPFRSGGALTAAGSAGRVLFASAGCTSCHYGATFSDEAGTGLKDIGTLKPSSGKRLNGPLLGIDVPSLRGAWATAPYLHDGSAATVSDAIRAHQGVSLGLADLANLAEFVLELDGSEPAVPSCVDGVKNGSETGVDCGGSCAACACAASVYEAETMTHSTGGAATGGWNIWSNGYIATNHTFTAGTTTLTVFASGSQAAGVWPNLRLTVGGTVIGNVTVNTTSYAPYSFTFAASAGTQQIRVDFTNDYYANGEDRNLLVDRVEVGCSVTPVTTSYQAENATFSQSVVETEWAGYTGAGYVNTNNVSGSYVEWTITANTAGTKQLAIRYALSGAARPASVTVNGTVVASSLSFPGTGAWTTWQSLTLDVALKAGTNVVRVTGTTAASCPNLDRLDLTQ